jgi:DNA polymerase-1
MRRADFPPYKAHRPDKPADLAEQILAAPDLLRATGVCTVVHKGFEADDVLASSAAQARRDRWRTVLMTSDRDAFALIDDSTSVLRVRNGGFDEAVMVTPESLLEAYGVTPAQYGDYAALRGDPSDNLRGVPGFGSATAARLLAAFGTLEAAWASNDDAVRAVVGIGASERLFAPAAREAVHRNRRLMRMHTELALPALDTARLPLDLHVMRRALAGRGINFGPSLWALTGGSAPPAHAAKPYVPRQWFRRKGLGRPREPIPGQLTLF